MKRVWLFIFIVLAACYVGLKLSPSISPGDIVPSAKSLEATDALPSREQLRRSGKWLVDHQGRVVILHGVNAVWKHAPYAPPDSLEGFTYRDADWLAENGFNAVRLGVLFAGVMPRRYEIDHDYLDKIDRVVQLLASRHIYVMLDFHQDLYGDTYQGEGFPDWSVHPENAGGLLRAGFPLGYVTPRVSAAFDGLWNNDNDLQGDFRDAWTAVAARWKDSNYLMGYDLINEPWSGSHWPACARPSGCPKFETEKLQPFYEHVLAGIRKVDPYNIVWIEPQVLFDFGAQSHLGTHPIDDEQLGLSWHNYCFAATLMQAYGVKQSTTCERLEKRVDQNATRLAARLGSASLLSEFGASDDLADTRRVTEGADRSLVGWTYWSYKNWGDPTTQAQGSGAQSMFKRDTDLSSVKQEKLAILQRPYPQFVAGIPLEFSYDADKHIFFLKYSTKLTSGWRAPRDAQTQIYIPKLHFPNGYEVKVQGGYVTSADNARVLLVAADWGEAEVEVTVFDPSSPTMSENQ